TEIAEEGDAQSGVPAPIKIECDGTDLDYYVEGNVVLSTTSMVGVGNVRCGLGGFPISTGGAGSASLDDWVAEDLGGGEPGGPVIPVFLNHYRQLRAA